MVVAGVGSFVDYKKEVQFVKSRMKSDEKNVVSPHSDYLRRARRHFIQTK